MNHKRKKVFLVDDHPGTREGLRKVIEYEDEFSVCGEASTVELGVSGILQTHADVAVIDLELGKQSGLDILVKLQSASRKIPVLILSMHSETLYAEKALHSGAHGYLMKSESPDEILLALHQVARGDRYLSPTMNKKLRKKETSRE